ncbi:hypothetical protein AGDE_12132 [Angomonas deanei]|nr:hypothetical protein AGDE_12132 [Angomonas deanei]|eukprot:EPY24867.1 hypothetical protein AGDE_12132 [Angomonas deanei]
MQTVKQLFSREDATEEQQAAWTTGIQSVGGLASVVALQELSPTLRPKVPVQVMNYLCDVLESPEASETLLRAVLQAGRVILRDAPLETINLLAADMQARLSKPPKDATAPQKEQHLATATVWLTMISCRLQQVDLLEAIVEQQSRILNNSQSAMVHRCVCDAMSEITKNETIRKSPKIDDFMEKCLKQVFHSGSYVKKKAHGAGVAGVLNGLGLSGLRRYHLLEEIEKAAKEKQNEKSGAMVLIEALCDTMGNRFEPYALHLSNILLEGVADPDLRISECADDASRVFMSSLTGVGLRQLIPKLIEALSTDVAKKRVPPLNFVGYVAFCSPKQLAATLPQIMKHINSCLFDVNTAVSQAAYHALKRVAGVVSNPEIQEHVDLILNAMRSPSTEIEPALDALLYTRYVNVVDAASLALIIPVLSRGLGGQMAHRTRPRSAQIIASMISLVGDPKALAPYAEELIQLLQESCQDPQPESRTTAAKALGALSAALGGDLVENIVQWSFSVMQRITNSSTIEKAGAAQALVEVINCCGDSVFESHFDTIEGGMTSEKPPIREGFLYIMVYAPPILRTESFQRILPIAFPWVLDGLSHYSDKVRDVALAAGESIISLYGTRQLSLVLEPLLVSVVSEVTTLRHSSLILTSKLLLHVVSNIKKKMRVQQALETVAEDDREEVAATIEATEAGNDEGLGIVLESARDVERQGYSLLGQLEVTLGTTNLNRVLSAIYCGRHEHSVNVRTDTNNAWQAAVASIRTAVSKIFGTLVPLLVRFASSENPDCVEVAEKSIEFTCRLGETVDSFVGDLCEVYKQDDRRSHLGALNCIACVASQMDNKRLIAVSGEILGVMMPAMQDQDQEVQESARKVFAMLTKAAGSVDVVEKAVITQLESGATNGVVEVVKVKPATALEIIMNRLTASKTHTYQHVELISAIISVPEAEEELHKYVKETVQLILLFISQKLEGVTKLAEKYFGLVGVGYRGVVVDTIQKALRVKQTRRAGLIAAVAVSCSVEVDDLSSITLGFATIIDCLADAEPETSAEAVRALPALLLNLETRIVDSLSEEDKQDATSGKRAAGRYLLQFLKLFHDNLPSVARSVLHGEEKFTILEEGEPKLIDVLIGLYNRGLDYGTPDQKVMAVECIQELLSLAPPDLCAAVSNTVAGRCSKVLFIRNEGRVVLALVRLCAQVLEFSFSTGKEKMVMSSMAQATFNAALCDSGRHVPLRYGLLLPFCKSPTSRQILF